MESYEKEAQKQQEKINKLKSDGTDPHTIKKQEEVLAETLQMIPDTKKRLDIAKKDLQDHMVCSNKARSNTVQGTYTKI